MIRGSSVRRAEGLKIAVVLYGQQRFHHPKLGILRTLRILKDSGAEVLTSGHLWPCEEKQAQGQMTFNKAKVLGDMVQISDLALIDHSPPPLQDKNLVKQATSQRQAIAFALQALDTKPDMVIFTRTDLWISNVDALIANRLHDGEVCISDFHHSGVDDNVAILNWKSFEKLSGFDYSASLESQDVLFGEHLRGEMFSRMGVRVSHVQIPYVILREGTAHWLDFALTYIRFVLRTLLPEAGYQFITSPKSEFIRLWSRAIARR